LGEELGQPLISEPGDITRAAMHRHGPESNAKMDQVVMPTRTEALPVSVSPRCRTQRAAVRPFCTGTRAPITPISSRGNRLELATSGLRKSCSSPKPPPATLPNRGSKIKKILIALDADPADYSLAVRPRSGPPVIRDDVIESHPRRAPPGE
jgi:hypothetical protein